MNSKKTTVEFTIFNKETGVILGSGHCSKKDYPKQVQNASQAILRGISNDVTQKVVNGKIVDKTPEEIEMENSLKPVPPIENQPANITNEQWQDVLDRLSKLEAEA